MDGTGSPAYSGEVVIREGRIVSVGSAEKGRSAAGNGADCVVVDCTGCVVAPGFIDVHSHSDLQVLENRTEKLLQGVTAEVVGNCGFSAYPMPESRIPSVQHIEQIVSSPQCFCRRRP